MEQGRQGGVLNAALLRASCDEIVAPEGLAARHPSLDCLVP